MVADVVVMLPPGDAALEGELRARGCTIEPLTGTELPPALSALNLVLITAENMRHGLWRRSFWRWANSIQPWWKRPFLEVLRACAMLARRNRLYRALHSVQRRWLRSLPIVDQGLATLDRLEPDLVFSTNPYRLNQLGPALAAPLRGIPSATAIMSWDNLSYKGMPLAPFSRYLVWNELMAHEVLRDGAITRSQVHVTGTPQFDFHLQQKSYWSRRELFDRIGGDPERRLITYSSSAPQALPEEPEIVTLLWDAIVRGEVRDVPQLLVRLHPHDPTDRFERLRDRCPGLLVCRPWASGPGGGSWFTPTAVDLALLTNTLRYSDVTVNMFSTVTLDAMILDRPAVCFAFSTCPATPAAVYLRESPDFGHCAHLVDTGGVRVARNATELIATINNALLAPQADRAERATAVSRLCGVVDGCASERVAAALLDAVEVSADTEPAALARVGAGG